MKKMLVLGILVTVVLGWVSLSYKTQDVPSDGLIIAPSSRTGLPFAYKYVKARTLCEGTNLRADSNGGWCDPPMIHNYFALAGDIALCILAGALTSFAAYGLSRPHKLHR